MIDGIRFLHVSNWKNLPNISLENIGDISVIIGPNASGKSNFLDILVFLRDISNNGLQNAVVNQRGGMSKLRSLSARRITDISISIGVEIEGHLWSYNLVFNRKEKKPGVTEESASKPYVKEEVILMDNIKVENSRDIKGDDSDMVTFLETPFKNLQFRPLVEFFRNIDILHIVPQMVRERQVKDADKKELDMYGRNFIERIGRTPEKTRKLHLNKIARCMKRAVPNFSSLALEQDVHSGVYHLVAKFNNWRGSEAKHNELFLSDGTVRLIGILWTLLEKKKGILLIDEPEISLHNAIVSELPKLITRMQLENNIQVFVTTHNYLFIEKNTNINLNDIFLISPQDIPSQNRTNKYPETTIERINQKRDVAKLLDAGWSRQEAILEITSNQLELDL